MILAGTEEESTLGEGGAWRIHLKQRQHYKHIHQKGHTMENELSASCTFQWRSLSWILVAAAVLTPMGSCQRVVAPDPELPEVGPDWAAVQEYLEQEHALGKKDSQERFSKERSRADKSPRETEGRSSRAP